MNGYNLMNGSNFSGTALGSQTAVCVVNCTNQVGMGLYAFHPGTCGLAMCDGSAHMVSENISNVVFVRILTLRGHTAVTDSSF